MAVESAGKPPIPPVSRCGVEPDTTAPDGSEIRLLIDQRHHAKHASLCEVTLPAGQVSRPVWHRLVEEIWYVLAGEGRCGGVRRRQRQKQCDQSW